mmetsp:Transcript_89624/g.277196  ORF Transcript_89624/g.277196 Transcript_89624/m.277196 type:complete len:217 (+) Transcript_89624:217-867(+)
MATARPPAHGRGPRGAARPTAERRRPRPRLRRQLRGVSPLRVHRLAVGCRHLLRSRQGAHIGGRHLPERRDPGARRLARVGDEGAPASAAQHHQVPRSSGLGSHALELRRGDLRGARDPEAAAAVLLGLTAHGYAQLVRVGVPGPHADVARTVPSNDHVADDVPEEHRVHPPHGVEGHDRLTRATNGLLPRTTCVEAAPDVVGRVAWVVLWYGHLL